MDILSTLRQPLSMSMFRNSDDLFAEMALQRQLAATEIESLRSRAEKAEAENVSLQEKASLHSADAKTAWAECDELRKAIDSIEIEHGLSENGNLWRWWSAKAKELVKKNTALEATCEKLAKALEPFIIGDEALEQILFGEYKDDRPMNFRIPIGRVREARRALSEYRKEASNAG